MKKVPFPRRTLSLFLALVSVVLLLGGCATVEPPPSRFPATADSFFQQLRWSDFQGASQHLEARYRDGFLKEFTGLKDLQITDVRLESSVFHQKGRQVVTSAVLEYYLLPSITVKTFTFRQEWKFHRGSHHHPGHWVIVTPFPKFP